MKTSESIGAIAKALLKCQTTLLPAMKTAQNPHLKNRYADLGAVWEAAEGALKDAGLVVIQCPGTSERGVTLTTRILHGESAEWIESEITMPAGKGDAQAIGSAITYARRYAISAMLGVLAEDDDGEAAQGRGKAAAASNGHGPAAPSETNYATVAEQIRDAIKRGRLDWAEGGFRKYFGKGSPSELRAAVWADIEAAKKAPQNGARS